LGSCHKLKKGYFRRHTEERFKCERKQRGERSQEKKEAKVIKEEEKSSKKE